MHLPGHLCVHSVTLCAFGAVDLVRVFLSLHRHLPQDAGAVLACVRHPLPRPVPLRVAVLVRHEGVAAAL